MKYIHLSDLHLGKRVNEFSMIEDQKYILTKIINIIDEERPDGVIIAGDVYDKSVPTTEAVTLFDDFLVRLSKRDLKVFIISGNHDSAERISFGRNLISKSGVYLSNVFSDDIKPLTFQDKYGDINIYLLPFIKPLLVRSVYNEESISTYTEAVKFVIDRMNVDKNSRNILVTHQFVTGAIRSDSEELSVGGSDNVDVQVFDDFDYVALGHIHRPQKVGRETVRYSGTPLKYSFSEVNHKKTVSVVEFLEKGNINIREVELIPKRDMREISGSYMEITSKDFYEGTEREDYLHITLTDEEDVVDAIGKLRVIYPNIMKLDYDNKRTRENRELSSLKSVDEMNPIDLFSELYTLQNNQDMSEEQRQILSKIIEEVWEVK